MLTEVVRTGQRANMAYAVGLELVLARVDFPPQMRPALDQHQPVGGTA